MLYLVIGLVVGALGTLIGVGGGFVLVPLLFFLHPEMEPEQVTAISLFCVTLNALSGSVQFLIKRQIHLKAGLLFAACSIPGALAGVMATQHVARGQFENVYAVFICVMASYLLWRSFVLGKKGRAAEGNSLPEVSARGYVLGAATSSWVGFIAGFFGVGGGIIHVPFLNRVLRFPVRYATATSQFILALTTGAAVIKHYYANSFRYITEQLSSDVTHPFTGGSFVIMLAVGMVGGAQIGAWASRRMNPAVVIRILAIVLIGVAARILFFK
jgi:uncharacterized protein